MHNFRGLTKDGKMVYGWYVLIDEKHIIIPIDATISFCAEYDNGFGDIGQRIGSWPCQVIRESVAQQVGRQDKNGNEIYAGDSLRTPGGQILKVEIPDLINGDGKFRSIVIEECEIEEKSK